jgi:hypothetical protein
MNCFGSRSLKIETISGTAVSTLLSDSLGLSGRKIVDISPYAGQTITVRLVGIVPTVADDRLAIGVGNVYVNADPSAADSLAKQVREKVSKCDLALSYPNPFNLSTTIRFNLQEKAHVSLAIFDVLGKRVAELINGYVEAGLHSSQWDASNVASGIYFARFIVMNEAGGIEYSKANKLVLMK